MDQSQPQVQQVENLRAPVDCPCGCKDLTTDGMIKRHLMILLAAVFFVSLGLVALHAFQRDLQDKMQVSEAGQAQEGPGATQAAESWSAMTPADEYQNGYFVVQGQRTLPTQQLYQVYNPQFQMPYASPNSNLLRQDAPAVINVPVRQADGSTRLRRWVTR